ncbi:MAG: DUF420 domain-containing protein [Planctomycetota bacterium]
MFPGYDGFLGTRASLAMDLVVVALVPAVVVLFYSLYQVRRHQRYELHKKLQIGLALVLLAAVTIFEVDVRINGWVERARPSPYYDSHLYPLLYIHLVFAILTPILWGLVIFRALRNFPKPPTPGAHSATHSRLGWIAALFFVMTTITGWTWYYVAFAAS